MDEKRDIGDVLLLTSKLLLKAVNSVIHSKKIDEKIEGVDEKLDDKKAQKLEKEAQKIQGKIDKENEKMERKKTLELLKERNKELQKQLDKLKTENSDLVSVKENEVNKIQDLEKDILKLKEANKDGNLDIKESLKLKYKSLDPSVEKAKKKEITINKKLIASYTSKDLLTRIPYQKDKYLLLPRENTRWLDNKNVTLYAAINRDDILKIYNSNKEVIGEIKGDKIHEYYDMIKNKEVNQSIENAKDETELDEVSVEDISNELGLDDKKHISKDYIDIEESLTYIVDGKSLGEIAENSSLDGLKEYNKYNTLAKQGLVKLDKKDNIEKSKITLTRKGKSLLNRIQKYKEKNGRSPSNNMIKKMIKAIEEQSKSR